MIILKLFWVFSYIGLFNFGGGYAMISFIQSEVVTDNGWMTETEFTDIVAISQMTPGPIGINAATYVGYTAVMNDAAMNEMLGESPALMGMMGITGAMVATLGVIWLPFIVMIMVSKIILRYKDNVVTKSIFGALRPAVIGLLISAMLALLTDVDINNIADLWSVEGNFGISKANFGAMDENVWGFALSIVIFGTVLWGSLYKKWNILYTLLACAVVGLIAYGAC